MLNTNIVIPHNIMELEDDQFFEFVKHFSGEKVAVLLQFQDISNVNCLLHCADPFEILTYDSNDLIDLKKKTCIKLNDNTFTILPGVKSKMNILKDVLIKKCNQLKKAPKTSSNIPITNDPSTTTLTSDNSSSPANRFPGSATLTPLSSNINLLAEEKIKQYLIGSLNDWCRKMNEDKYQKQQIFQLKENTDYEITIDINGNKVLIRCQCGTTTTLGQKNNIFILSNYIRHLTHRNPCLMVKQKLEHITAITTDNAPSTSDNEDTSVDPTTNSISNLIPSTQTSLEKRKRTQGVHSSLVQKKKKI